MKLVVVDVSLDSCYGSMALPVLFADVVVTVVGGAGANQQRLVLHFVSTTISRLKMCQVRFHRDTRGRNSGTTDGCRYQTK